MRNAELKIDPRMKSDSKLLLFMKHVDTQEFPLL